MNKVLTKEFLKILKSVTSKRPKTVIDHILKHGFITTEELQNTYGYEHPPRAARDVREKGIPLETFKVENAQGRKIAAYKFGDISKVRDGVLAGRKTISKEFKDKVAVQNGKKCGVCLLDVDLRYLQVDHRVPYQVGGEGDGSRDIADYMLICASCNRAKSWSCEQCVNWQEIHDVNCCKCCYWASPEGYQHIATRELRRLEITWDENEIKDYEKLIKAAEKFGMTIGEYVKSILK